MSVMYFLKPESRWNPGLETYVCPGNSPDPDNSGGSAVTSTSTSLASSPSHDSFEFMDEEMDLEIPPILESPVIVQNLLALSEKLRPTNSNKISLVELERILNGLNSVESLRRPPTATHAEITLDCSELKKEHEKRAAVNNSNLLDNQSDIVPCSTDSSIPTDDEFFYSMINSTEITSSPEVIFDKSVDSIIKKEPSYEDKDFLLPSQYVDLSSYMGLDMTFPPPSDFMMSPSMDMPADIMDAPELSDDFIFACQDADIESFFPKDFITATPINGLTDEDLFGGPPRLLNSRDYLYECEDESPLLSGEKDPFIGQEVPEPKTEITIKEEPEDYVQCYKIYTSNSDRIDGHLVKEMWSERELISYTHSYCKPIKIECKIRLPPPESVPNHDKRTELSAAPIPVEKVVPVKRGPGRPRKNALPAGTLPKPTTKSAQPKKAKRSGQPPAKKAKVSSVCNEKRLQHNVLERNRRNTMRESMESVEHRLPERILQLTQLALNTERAERSEEVENDFTNAVFRNVDDLLRRNYDPKNVKCRKINTKKGTRYPKMVVLLSATFYYLHMHKEVKSKLSLLKKFDHLFRHEVSRPSKKVRKY